MSVSIDPEAFLIVCASSFRHFQPFEQMTIMTQTASLHSVSTNLRLTLTLNWILLLLVIIQAFHFFQSCTRITFLAFFKSTVVTVLRKPGLGNPAKIHTFSFMQFGSFHLCSLFLAKQEDFGWNLGQVCLKTRLCHKLSRAKDYSIYKRCLY